MNGFREFKHHVFGSLVLNTEWPMTAKKSVSIIRLNFLFLPIQRRWTLTWRWSCLWPALDHTFVLSWILESVRGGQMSWVLGIFSLELHRCYINTVQIFHMIILKIPYIFFFSSFVRVFFYNSPGALSLRRRRSGLSRSDEFCHTASFSRSMCTLRNQSLIHQWSLSSPWINFSVALNNCFTGFQRWFLTNRRSFNLQIRIEPWRYRFGIRFHRGLFVSGNLSVAPAEILDSNIFL